MHQSSKISSKGQVTVPREIRKRLGVKTGDRVEFVLDDGKISIRPAGNAENPFAKYAGALPAFSSAREINAWIKTLRNEEADD